MPSIKPEQDQVESRFKSGRPAVAPRQSNFNSMLVFVVVLMAIVMGVVGYTLFDVQGKLERANQLLAQGQDNISEIDARLAATGTDVSKTLQDLKIQVSTNFSEIDKLWALSHRKNKPDIQNNLQAIEKLQIDLDGRLNAMDISLQSMAEQLDVTLKEMRTFRQGLMTDSDDLVTQVALMHGQVQNQAVLNEANKRNLAVMNNRIKEIDEAIMTFDQYRLQVNQRLLELRR